MIVINPDLFLLPCFRISPFKTQNISFNNSLPFDIYAIDYFNNKFGEGQWQYVYNGREAIKFALKTYNLDKNDLVTIITTSQNFYISSCVTNTIESFCKWNREILPQTKIIFVNHEFGYPYPKMDEIKSLGLPIIEDCCTTFFSQDLNNMIGKYGDFALYSFPKFFPIQIGGLLVSNNKTVVINSTLDEDQTQNIQNVISYYLRRESKMLCDRNELFNYSISLFSKLGFTEYFSKSEQIEPSVLLLNNHFIVKDLNKLKKFFANHGIQSSVFYGTDAFFIPNHQNLSKTEIEYMYKVLLHYLKNNNI